MKPKFDINKYTRDTAMHCPDRDSADMFLQFLHDIGRRWCDGEEYIPFNEYRRYLNDICFNFPEGKFGSVTTYRDWGYTVLNFYDFDWSEDNSIEESEELSSFLNLFVGDSK